MIEVIDVFIAYTFNSKGNKRRTLGIYETLEEAEDCVVDITQQSLNRYEAGATVDTGWAIAADPEQDDGPLKVLLLDTDTVFTMSENIPRKCKRRRELRDSALAKLTPQEREALRVEGF